MTSKKSKKAASEPNILPQEESVDFETALKSLEGIIGRMESESLNLEDSLACFEQGISLAKKCQVTLQQAKLRVEQLTQSNESE